MYSSGVLQLLALSRLCEERTKHCSQQGIGSRASLPKVWKTAARVVSCTYTPKDKPCTTRSCAAVRRHEQLAGEHQATSSEAQQLRSQNASLIDQVLSLTSQLNTEKVKCEQQLRTVRIKSKRCSDLEQHQQYLEQQVYVLSPELSWLHT